MFALSGFKAWNLWAIGAPILGFGFPRHAYPEPQDKTTRSGMVPGLREGIIPFFFCIFFLFVVGGFVSEKG